MAVPSAVRPVELAVHFDATGSMTPVLMPVRRRVDSMLTQLFKGLPKLRMSVSANGDYCDAGSTYVTRWSGFMTNLHDLCKFVRDIPATGGGDLPECYELVLREAQDLDWSVHAEKGLVLIADDVPHPAHDLQNVRFNGVGIDWRREADALARLGIPVYAVQALNKGSHATAFYRELADRTNGRYLILDQFSEVPDLIMAICYGQGSAKQLASWEEEVARAGRMTRSADANFAILRGRKVSERYAKTPAGLHTVPPGRFQILFVDEDIPMRDFVAHNGLLFEAGKGFYEFTKSEIIREKNEVVLRDKLTGDMYTGAKAREMIGVPFGVRDRVRPVCLHNYDIFVQSTSYTRKLVGGTRFMYEVDMSR